MSQRTRKKISGFFVPSLCALCFLFLSSRSTLAWDDGGHMLVAQIAYSQMSEAAKTHANTALQHLPDVRRSTPNSRSRAYDFITAACWMDDIKSSPEYDAYRSSHYINPPEGAGMRAAKKPNALDTLEYFRDDLTRVNNRRMKPWISLAILIHVVGDLHQPLHATGRDVGGNTFPILGVPGIEARLRRDGRAVDNKQPTTGANSPVYQRLHAFWDSAYRYNVVGSEGARQLQNLYSLGSSSRPNLENIAKIAADIVEKYPPSSSGLPDKSTPAEWAQESNRLALTFALNTPRARKPSDEYFQKSHDVACAQIALAGYRLANLLNTIFQTD